MKLIQLAVVFCLVITGFAQAEEPYENFVVSLAESAPVLDGDLSDWNPAQFKTLSVSAAIEDDSKNLIGDAEINVAMSVVGDRIYMAFRWPDSSKSDLYRPWEWKVSAYKRGQIRDDMLAVRFSLSEAYDRSMLTATNYEVDLWVWSAGRSNLIGFADDYRHRITTKYIEDAAEYELPDGEIIYIDRSLDSGEVGYGTFTPDRKTKTEQKVDAVSVLGDSTGSLADVTAKGVWNDGFWSVELSRLLNTGNADDRALISGEPVITQFAVFDKNNAEHKSVSEPYWLILP